MDEQLETINTYTNKVFTSRHFAMAPSKPGTRLLIPSNTLEHLKTDVVIYQTHLKPPHFDIIVKGEKWEVKPGRYNLFHCLAVFVYYFKSRCNGLLHQTDLRNKRIQLYDVVQ